MSFDFFKNAIDVYTVVLSIVGIVAASRQLMRHWRYRHIKKIWGLKDGDKVLLVCSELDEPEKRQLVEPREFIYLMKYGDVDAWVETVFSLLRVYPNIEFWLISAGELTQARVDLDHHIILIGGPDYNSLTERLLRNGQSRIRYRSPFMTEKCRSAPEQIGIVDQVSDQEFVGADLSEDYGYFERIKNPYDSTKFVILIGGCHTVGVTGAAKMFSAFSDGRPDLLAPVRENARVVAKEISTSDCFSIVCKVDKVGATIATPTISASRLCIAGEKNCRFDRLTKGQTGSV